MELVQDLRLEVKSLKQELQELKSDGLSETKQVKQENPRDPDDTPIVEGDICEVLNSYKGLKGIRLKVTKSANEKFTSFTKAIQLG